MFQRVAGGLLLVVSLALAALAFYFAGPQPALDADDMAFNTRIFQFFGGGAAVTFLGALMVLLRKP